ncbi:MAG: hypothetical protein K0R00_37 [Herbinix sp.]|jgi:hypothetical protein|nr:hypothetical protein [Herbinix sp.]
MSNQKKRYFIITIIALVAVIAGGTIFNSRLLGSIGLTAYVINATIDLVLAFKRDELISLRDLRIYKEFFVDNKGVYISAVLMFIITLLTPVVMYAFFIIIWINTIKEFIG